ncbi:MAG: hypothetical protein N3B10_12730 [Armatimonadetes bacterium]|nr:hypothetical protein [Armatimonadota bacterium]MCX7969331.1 hypothetical protein [Armatimonadota bacterium]MDW8144668.1 hypothetical protein [Armatimonadota bacterium]
MSVLDALTDMLRSTHEQGKWAEGQRFFVQVRAYLGNQVLIRLHNMETGLTCDRIYDLSTGEMVAESERTVR